MGFPRRLFETTRALCGGNDLDAKRPTIARRQDAAEEGRHVEIAFAAKSAPVDGVLQQGAFLLRGRVVDLDIENKGAYILNLTGGNPALASVGTNVTQRPMTGKPRFGDRIATKTGPRQPANLPVKLSM